MAKKVRVGVVGTSWWADLMHLPSFKSHPGAELAAICGRNQERAREMAAKYGIPRVFGDYREMIRSRALDAVAVSTPDDLHHEITLAALDAGLHVLCEKPLALTLQDAKQMYERAEKAGVKHVTYFTNRWSPVFRYLRRLVEEGYVGRCVSAELRYVAGHGRNLGYRWRFDGKRSLGVLGDMGSHMIDLARWLVGDITGVSAHLAISFVRRGDSGTPVEPVNDSAMLLVEFAGGGHGAIHASAVTHVGDRGQQMHIVLNGESGILEVLTSIDGYRIYAAKSDEKTLTALRIPPDLLCGIDQDSAPWDQWKRVFTEHSAGCRAFVDAILQDRAISPSFHDGVKAMEVVTAALESHRTRTFVSV